jgi:hypothetical protein
MADGGTYVVEDLHTSYWPEFGGTYLGKKTTVTMLKSLVDNLNSEWYKGHKRAENKHYKAEYMDSHIESIQFYKALCFIRRARA